MNCPANFLMHLMCIVNGLFVGLGVLIIIVGAIALTEAREYTSLLEDGFFSIPALLLTIGVFVTILFFFGCHGLKQKSYCMAMTFAFLLSVILLMEVIGGISAYMLRDRTESAFNSTLENSFKKYNNVNETEVTAMWNDIQKNLKCCGINGSVDYEETLKISPPLSCCKSGNCTVTAPDVLYPDGCGPILEKIAVDIIGKIAKWSIGVAALHLIWIIGTCYFAVEFRRSAYESV